ncbi:MAG: putative bifunctional diguanylate cyclase/phosphodiesterase [Myxococcota bacterium]
MAADEQGSPPNPFRPLAEARPEAYVGAVTRHVRDIVCVVDRAGRLAFVNDALAGMLGWDPAASLGSDALSVVHPEDRQAVRDALARCVAEGAHAEVEFRGRHRDGHWVELESVAVSQLRDPLVHGVVVCTRDVGRHKRIEERLRSREAWFLEVTRQMDDVLQVVTPDLHTLFVGGSCDRVLGWPRGDLVDLDPFAWVHTADREKLQAAFERCLAADEARIEVYLRGEPKDGGILHLQSLLVNRTADETVGGVVITTRDVTAFKRRDDLTGLPNRSVFLERLGHLLRQLQRDPARHFGLLLVNLDRLRKVNEGLGPDAGDELIQAAASRMRAGIRPTDTLARLGGDEFGVLIEPIDDVTDATRVAQRLLRLMEIPYDIDDHELHITASIGVALSNSGYTRPADVLRDAHAAAVRVKARGGAAHEMFDEQIGTRARDRLNLETELRYAIDRREFVLHYQPIIDLEDGHVASFEALVRWQHPERGLVSPGEFIEVAEESGLIDDLGWIVMQEACAEAMAWEQQSEGVEPPQVTVNVSGCQLSNPNLATRLEVLLRESGLPGHRLELELTETALIRYRDVAERMIREIRSLGVRLCLDDFGTGYSSLSYLHRYPFDVLKIDRSFVDRVKGDHRKQEMVRAIRALAQALELEVVAEGIETPEDLAAIRTLRCHYGQGYFFARPLPADDAKALLRSDSRW